LEGGRVVGLEVIKSISIIEIQSKIPITHHPSPL
jgi:hypothetical protein